MLLVFRVVFVSDEKAVYVIQSRGGQILSA